MTQLFFWVFVTILGHVSSYLRLCSPFPSRRVILWGNTRYNAFDSDPALRTRLLEEVGEIAKADLSSSSLRDELSSQGLPYKDVVDKHELQRRVAMVRIQKEMVQEDAKADLQKARTGRVQDILAEIKRISPMGTGEIIDELHRRKVAFKRPVDRSDVERTLALARLGMLRPRIEGNNESGNWIMPGDELMGMRGALRESYKRRDELLYTKSEKVALDGLKRRGRRNETVFISHHGNMTPSQASELNQLESFDEIRTWVSKQSLITQRELCEAYGVDLIVLDRDPSNDSGTLVADAILSARTQAAYQSAPIDVRPIDTNYNVLNPEAELFESAIKTCSRVLDSAQRISTQIYRDIFSEGTGQAIASEFSRTTQSTLKATGRGVLSSILSLGIAFTKSIAQWSVGPQSPAASQAIFAASAICVVCRRGIPSFFGIMLAIRICRGWSETVAGSRKGNRRRGPAGPGSESDIHKII